MNRIFELTLKVLRRKIIPKLFQSHTLPELEYEMNKKACNKDISDAILAGKPYMVARFGSTELNAITNYLGVKNNPHSIMQYIRGDINEWWWNWKSINQLETHSGFFPVNKKNVIQFSELMLKDAREIDILGSWCREEWYVRDYVRAAKKYFLGDIEPLYEDTSNHSSWTHALKGKKVLVVHPFANTIVKQYLTNRTKIFSNPEFLPNFELHTIKAVQSLGGSDNFLSWFDALENMKQKMDMIDYDVAIIGCGAYGLPLAAHAKRSGRIAIHLAGATQILFGIRGRRWDKIEKYNTLFNEYWVRPDVSETPPIANSVEGGCYW